MEAIAIFFVIVLALGLALIRGEFHENTIKSHIESMGGQVTSIERRTFFLGSGLFM